MINPKEILLRLEKNMMRLSVLKKMFKKSSLKEKLNSFVPYLASFYYIEIVYLMIFLNFVYGKYIAVTAGLILAFILTFHVIRLFSRKDINRKIQLYIMDIHFAYSLAFLFNRIFSGYDLTMLDYALVVFRVVTALFEFAAILVLTDRNYKGEYCD